MRVHSLSVQSSGQSVRREAPLACLMQPTECVSTKMLHTEGFLCYFVRNKTETKKSETPRRNK